MIEITHIPQGNTPEDVAGRRNIIAAFYHKWKERNPQQRRYNVFLKDFINIRFVSITETCTHASRSYLSTLAVLQLDAILTGARKVASVSTKGNANQKPFEKMLIIDEKEKGMASWSSLKTCPGNTRWMFTFR